jgi:hypothetical protein
VDEAKLSSKHISTAIKTAKAVAIFLTVFIQQQNYQKELRIGILPGDL